MNNLKAFQMSSLFIQIILFTCITCKNYYPLFYGTDSTYVTPTLVSMTSICDTADEDNFYQIYVLVPGDFSEDNKEIMKSVEHNYPSNCNVTFISMEDQFKYINLKDERFGTPTYYRLHAPSVFPQYDKILYLDGDTIAAKDISEIYSFDFHGNYLLGRQNMGCNKKDKFIMQKLDKIVNSGVLLMNLKLLREDDKEKDFDEFLRKYAEKTYMHDQPCLNWVCRGKVDYLPPKFGQFGLMKIEKTFSEGVKIGECLNEKECFDAYLDPVIIHYITKRKPWKPNYFDNYEQFWWKMAVKTNYYEKIYKSYMNKLDNKEHVILCPLKYIVYLGVAIFILLCIAIALAVIFIWYFRKTNKIFSSDDYSKLINNKIIELGKPTEIKI